MAPLASDLSVLRTLAVPNPIWVPILVPILVFANPKIPDPVVDSFYPQRRLCDSLTIYAVSMTLFVSVSAPLARTIPS